MTTFYIDTDEYIDEFTDIDELKRAVKILLKDKSKIIDELNDVIEELEREFGAYRWNIKLGIRLL